MRRILSIAICSLLVLENVSAWRGAVFWNDPSTSYLGGSALVVTFGTAGQGTWQWNNVITNGSTIAVTNTTVVIASGYTTPYVAWLGTNSVKIPGTFSVLSNEWVRVDLYRTNSQPPMAVVRRWSQDPRTGGAQVGEAFYNSGYSPPETECFEFLFGPEWSGVSVSVVATNGQTLGLYGLPAQIGPGGYSFTNCITTNASLLNGARVLLDGINVDTLAAMTANGGATNAFRPGYDVEFDGSYGGGEWQIRRSDGSVAMSGGIATLGDAASGRFTLTGTNTGTLWTRVPAGDGMGSAWVQSPVSFSGNNSVTSYYLANNPGAPSPTPFPTPAPLTSPTPAPTPPAFATNAPVTVTTNVPAPTNDVSVNVEPLALEDADDGEQQVVDGIGELSELVVGIVDDMRTAQTNIIASGAAFSELRLGGVGKNCTFQFGPASITLQTSEPVRAGLKLLILGIGAFAAAAMIRGAVQS